MTKTKTKSRTVTGTALAAYASYLVNGDASGLSELDQLHADQFARWLGGSIVDVSEDTHFSAHHDARQFGALAGDIATYTALIS